ncbi:MAG: asparagine synthase-related protein [Candidatus Ratteibacteria bacterium]|jgi:asparagine synthase (glutamine-hydrolysing)
MGGIVVVTGKDKKNLLHTIAPKLSHRGDLKQTTHTSHNALLSYLSSSSCDVNNRFQILSSEKENYTVIFDGKMYNHNYLKKNLKVHHSFSTTGDAELLLRLYQESGTDMLRKLDGPFALVIATPHTLLLARDQFGIKPLYYTWNSNQFIAASEIKAFPPFSNVMELPPGHVISTNTKKPWMFASSFSSKKSSFLSCSLQKIEDAIHTLLTKAVKKRIDTTQEIGLFLSGGLDSSLIAAILKPHISTLHTFTAGIKGAPDLESARKVATFLGTIHHEYTYTKEKIENALPTIIQHLESFDAPLVRSAIPMFFISTLMSNYVQNALSGEGADELFAGYDYLHHFSTTKKMREEQIKIIHSLHKTGLQRVDRISMAHGVDVKIPFLDRNLVRFVQKIPVRFLTTNNHKEAKWILRDAFQGILPHSILYRKKMKFSEGAGSAEIVAKIVSEKINPREFQREQELMPHLWLSSPEELFYYRIWKKVMPKGLSPLIVGRTLDKKAVAY